MSSDEGLHQLLMKLQQHGILAPSTSSSITETRSMPHGASLNVNNVAPSSNVDPSQLQGGVASQQAPVVPDRMIQQVRDEVSFQVSFHFCLVILG